MKNLLLSAVGIVMLLVIACGSPAPTPTPAVRTRFVYTHFVFPSRAAWHPGEEIQLSWTPTKVQTPEPEPQTTELRAVLTGPFDSVAALKQAVSGAVSGAHEPGDVALPRTGRKVSITPIIQSTVGRDILTATLRLPTDLPPGYYNLTQAVVTNGRAGTAASRGDGVIQVLPGAVQR